MKEKWKTLLLSSIIICLCIALLRYPQHSFEAAVRGLHMWWDVVFPSLLPFFIVSEILIGFGVVHFLGVLLEPFMRPLFKVPGIGGFVWAMGMASGYPAGAKLTARLRQQQQLSAIEAERLVSFTNSSNPLFIFGAISVGFFHNPNIGIILALSHYLGNICVGFMMRFHGKDENNVIPKQKKNLLRQAFRAMHETRLKHSQAIGKLLGDAVRSSIQTLLMIGGFIILFSVLNKLLYITNITKWLADIVQYALALFHLPRELSVPFIAGVFEITLGSQMTSEVTSATLLQKVMITSFILAFGGFSVQAQVASILAEAHIRFQPFFIARIFHGFFASFFAFLLWKPLYVQPLESVETLSVWLPEATVRWPMLYIHWIEQYGFFVTATVCFLYVVIAFRREKPPA
ncbi:sporulation integral membrane protein YlbJ [Anoxybacillus flavithermus]|uniref:Sporulation integral membrane protein YlbJ n=1 Tax=Anoxybacillus flavithermus TaxID=33934 RepID=A0A2G5RTS6_9BACL|nr:MULTISPECIES: sporulation integral membrane protein YlbJ [Anoxybacillus]KFZ43613.1 sporulation protein [Anoxybacillus sp. KU2-6(11)]PIC06106.1 sporulation integral membrane protein YlbJ [Anoxybacillus flavithermus]